jgi:hypothetical protein
VVTVEMPVRADVIRRTAAVVGAANLVFVVLVLTAPIDPSRVADRVREAFAEGDLGTDDYRLFDLRRGVHQYNDCLVLQMLSNPEPSPLQRALAPIIYKADATFSESCGVLRAIVVDGRDRGELLSFRYTRYWQGDMVLAAWMLGFVGLATVRTVLVLVVMVAIATLAVVGTRAGPRVRATALSIALAAALLWAAPFYDPGLTHGPGDAVVVLALVPIALLPGLATRQETIAPYAAGLGAILGFLEMFTGQLPTAGPWLAVMTLAAARDTERAGNGGGAPSGRAGSIRPRALAASAFLAFGLAAGTTVVVKQLLAYLFATPQTGELFLSQLTHYLSAPSSGDGTPGLLLPFRALLDSAPLLTYGSPLAGKALIVAVTATWLAAAVRAWRRRATDDGRDALVILAAALVPLAWVLVLPGHTYLNAGVMVRMFVVPAALAPLALVWPPPPRPSPASRQPLTRPSIR